MKPNLEIITIEELADFFRMNKRSLYRKVQRKEIPGAFRVGGTGAIRFIKSDVLQWIKNQSTVQS